MKELKMLLAILLKNDRIIGTDICGECAFTIKGLFDPNLRRDDSANKALVEFFRSNL